MQHKIYLLLFAVLFVEINESTTTTTKKPIVPEKKKLSAQAK
jgi:hypothetical protein